MNNMKGIRQCVIAAIFLLTVTTRNATAQTQRPGGINNSNYTWLAWLTPDSYNNGIWTNLIQGSASVGDFTRQDLTPLKVNSGYNFHPSVNFPFGGSGATDLTGRYWLLSANNTPGIETSDNMTVVIVMKRSTAYNYYDYLLGLSNESGVLKGGIGWRNAGSTLTWRWGGTVETDLTMPSISEGILVLDNANDTSNKFNYYLNGSVNSKDATEQSLPSQKIAVASGRNETGSVGYEGTIQEIIILKANGETDRHLRPLDLQKIHSYLAIKYGFTLSNGDNYVNSAGQSVWDRTYNAGYGYHITGIARDDASGLYQKQSQSNTSSLLTVFVGSNVAALNGSNGGQLPNGVYALFGSNNGNINTVENLLSEIPVAPGSTLTVNYLKGLKYKAQLTGAATQKVKLKFDIDRMGGALPEYVLVSSSSSFLPGDTKVFPFSGSTAEIELTEGSDGYNYIAFGGHRIGASEGPGGVGGSKLKLWLRADDASSLVTEMLTVPTSTGANGNIRLRDYPNAPAGTVVPAVSEWKDGVRTQSYTYASGGTADSHLEPVYEPSNYMTNYHPAVQFWGTGNDRATWLANTSGVWSTKFPTDNKHSAFFVVNNNFSTNPWIYAMMFAGDAVPNDGANDYNGPGYGVDRPSSGTAAGRMVGRFRTNWEAGNNNSGGTRNLFSPGATTILGYHAENKGQVTGASGSYIDVLWRFNGLEDRLNGTIKNGSFGLNQTSIIGTGYKRDRAIIGAMSEVIMYDGALQDDDLQKIESYLALKYGITLTPSPNESQVNRFDYIFSDGGMLWNGTAGGKWATYYNRVAAVIRDDNADLHNRQSHSTNVGSILHMGVAGSRLGSNADLGDFTHDTEAVIWGDNNLTDTVRADIDPDGCGDFSHVFTRRWLVHKKTDSDRPVQMLVGAQNNSGNQLGYEISQKAKDLYDCLGVGYSVYMIVADSAEKITPGHEKYGQFTAVVPMQYLDGEQQCSYTFADSITYITFGFRQKLVGCTETVEFEGIKTFSWTQWTRQNYGSTVNAGITKNTPVDLGDGVQVTSTSVLYSPGVTAPAYYPSVTGSPVAGSLYLQRKNGALDASRVTVTINLSTPVRPEFSIYDIDGYASRFERITVSGSCEGGDVAPTLSYAGNPTESYYTINGNIATASVAKDLSPTDRNGQLNVSFSGGVTQIIITYAITNQIQVTTTHNLIISPIRFRQVPPPPPINEDGLSFTKEVGKRDISTCEPVEYSFYFGNVNCESKPVTFRDTLPHGMKWTGDISWNLFDPIDPSKISYQGDTILQITNLDVPGADVLRVTATAMIDDGEVPPETTRQFNNHAWIRYEQIVNNLTYNRILQSVDRETPTSQETWFNAIGGQRQDTVRSAITTNVSKYSADSTVTVTLTVTNPTGNDPVPSSYLDVSFDAGFEYVDGSFSSDVSEAVIASSGNGQLSIAGLDDGSEGFEIPAGESVYTFQLKAPALSGLIKEVDGSGVPTGEISPLQIEYIFTSETTDPCVILGMIDVSGWCDLPYKELIANHDRASTLTGIEVVIPVLANDSIPATCTPDLKVTTDPLHGEADFVNDSIRYKPASDFTGYDTLIYRLVCDDDTSYAYVSVYVVEIPDNVSDADCFVDPPVTEWSIQRLAQSPVYVNHYLIPMAGDIDHDGKVEIVAGKNSGGASSTDLNANTLYIFEMVNDALVVQQELELGAYINNVGSNMGIANVDGGDYAAIFVATTSTGRATSTNIPQYDYLQRKLVKYIYNGTEYVLQKPIADCPQYSGTFQRDAAQPMFADFNGDGIPEVVVLDKVYNARTLELLVDGNIQASTYPASGYQYGLGYAGHPNNSQSIFGLHNTSHMAIADMDNDGLPELIAGHCVYKIDIQSTNSTVNNTFTLWSKCDGMGPGGETHSEVGDGATSVADMDGDGFLDVIVTALSQSRISSSMYIWNPRTGHVMHTTSWTITSSGNGPSRAMVGDVDGDGQLEIVFLTAPNTQGRLYCLEFDADAKTLQTKWSFNNTDASGSTTLTLFDFNSDGKAELVYRDATSLYIIDGEDGQPKTSIGGLTNATANEYPLIVDVNNDGRAEIVTTGASRLHVFSSDPVGNWAAARTVWNQVPYNVVNINEDLTVPRYQMNPTTAFPGVDGLLGTADDIHPYNNFLQQQTTLNTGIPIWLTPDAVADPTISGPSMTVGNTVYVRVGIINRGDAALSPPIHVSLYRDFVALPNLMASGSDNTLMISKGDTGYVTVQVNMDLYPTMVRVVAKVNDNGSTYLYQPECKGDNNTMDITLVRPLIGNSMTKDARLLLASPVDTVDNRGTYPNPVSMLYSDTIEYTISAINANLDSGTVIIRDTIPAYLRYVPGTATWTSPAPSYASFSPGFIPGPPERDTLMFRFDSLAAQEPVTATFKALPASGVSASQPLFVNRAWITASDTLHIPTGNSTYHQGAGVSIVTFSASAGGEIFNATPQALDFRTSPRSGILVVPDEGYRFAGWSHDAYAPLRGERIEARSGIMLYDTLVIYGDVELRASFVPEEYPVRYHLHGGENAEDNPPAYTVESGAITLEAPRKAGDVFTGWTGSNGDDPQPSVTIPGGSTGERDYFANYLYSGRERIEGQAFILGDKIWSSGDELYILTAKAGSIVRVYSPDGILHKLQTIVASGETRIKLQRGIYIVMLNNGVGQKVIIEK